VPRSDGTTDLYIAAELFHHQFCADVPAPEAARMALTQRPVTHEALADPSGVHPLWSERPSWFVFGDLDLNIPAALHRFMAKRARARGTLEIPGASHALAVSHSDATVRVILEATELRAAA
jgi:pimeloyl-ACP methyl ester carboxylesterase